MDPTETRTSRANSRPGIELPYGLDWMDSPVDVARKISGRDDLTRLSFGSVASEGSRGLSRDQILKEWNQMVFLGTGLDRPHTTSLPVMKATFADGEETLGITLAFWATPGMLLTDPDLLEATTPAYLGAVLWNVEVDGLTAIPTCDRIFSKIEARYGVRRSGPEIGSQSVAYEEGDAFVRASRSWNGTFTISSCGAHYRAESHARRMNEGFAEWFAAEAARLRDAEAKRIRSGHASRMSSDF
ncbi:MAG: hypothetical protein IPK00_10300 [Deltaproteobacteria bacterium]|nr:hypothetical protein [Deltaproteobacteria bacterium]